MLKHYLLTLLLLAAAPYLTSAQTGGVGIGTTAPDASAALEIVSSSKGLLLPRLTAAQVAAIASPATGLLVFQTDGLAGFYYNAGTSAAPSWQQLTTATGTAPAFGNGLTQTGSAVGLGGTLGRNTTLGLAGYTLGLTGGNVGIGTSSPAGLLDVVGRSPQQVNVDQQNTFANSSINNVSSYWQSFTAGISGPLDQVVVYDNTFENVAGAPPLPGGALMTIYQGTGTSGSVLAAQSFMVPATGTSGTGVTFSTPATLVAGQVYTFSVDLVAPPSATTRMSTLLCNNNCYANGSSSLSGDYDVKFRTGQLVAGSASLVSVLTATSSGVGIGTVAPTQKLEVVGNVKISGVGNGLTFPDGTTQTSAINGQQTISKSGTTVTLSNGGGSFTDADGQQLSISGSTLSLTNGGSVTLPSSNGAGDNLGNHTATQNLGLNGNYLSNAPGIAKGLRVDNAGNVGLSSLVGSTTRMVTVAADGTLTSTAFPSGGGTADNLGNHTATQALNLDTYPLVGNGGSSGISISNAGQVGIDTPTPDASAALDVSSTTRGLLPPRLTQAQRDAIASPAAGLTIYNTTTSKLNTWNGTSWDASLSVTEQPVQNPAVTFGYTGGPQTYTVPVGVFSLLVDARGAQGGTNAGGAYSIGPVGGQGGRVQTTLAVTPGEVLTVYVGGQGSTSSYAVSAAGGYNGGGRANSFNGSGGGATDLRRSAAEPSTSLAERLVVAGGGGGGAFQDIGGTGGGLSGSDGGSYRAGQGGTQTAGGASSGSTSGNGALGQGGNVGDFERGPGGGGATTAGAQANTAPGAGAAATWPPAAPATRP